MQSRASRRASANAKTWIAAIASAAVLSACGAIRTEQGPALGENPGAPSGPLAGAYAPVELVNVITGDIWQTTAIDPTAFQTLDPAPWWRKNAPREAALPGLRSRFVRSPGATSDGEFQLRELYGHEFMLVAEIDSFPGRLDEGDALTMLLIQKHHRIVFRAGQRLRVLVAPNASTWIHVGRETGRSQQSEPLPNGWSYREAPLERDVEIELTGRVQRISDGRGDSYEGPVDLDEYGIRMDPTAAPSRSRGDS